LKKEDVIQVLQIDNQQVRQQQIEKIQKVKQNRDQAKAEKCLETIRNVAKDKTGSGNLLQAAIEAARARCTLGEISQALEDVFSRHVADSKLVSGAYRETFNDGKNNNELKTVIDRVEVKKQHFEFIKDKFCFGLEIRQSRWSTTSYSRC